MNAGLAATAARRAPELATAHWDDDDSNIDQPNIDQSNIATEARPRQQLRVLVVEDDPTDIDLSLRALQKGEFDTDSATVQTADEFLERVRHTQYDVILADYNLPHWNGMDTIAILRREDLDIPVIIVSGYLGDLKAVECIKQGAADYVLKDHLLSLPDCVRRALREKKLREENRRTQEDLARSNRDLEQFAYVASHDLQEPLRMVASYTQLLAERYKGKLDENADKYIHYAVDGATRMQMLVKDLLAFSRLGRQAYTLNSPIALPLSVSRSRTCVPRLRKVARGVERGEFPAIVEDAALLVHVFQNLIGNAIKFRGTEPLVVQITAEKAKQEIIVSIADNGIGIAPEHAELIFEIFKRLHTRAEYPGSGIGLAICKKIVEQHGGRIWMESKPGHGCTFRFSLPSQNVESTRSSK